MNEKTQSWSQRFYEHWARVTVEEEEQPRPPRVVVLRLRERQAQALERFLATGGDWSFSIPNEPDGVLSGSGHFLNSIYEPLKEAMVNNGIMPLGR